MSWRIQFPWWGRLCNIKVVNHIIYQEIILTHTMNHIVVQIKHIYFSSDIYLPWQWNIRKHCYEFLWDAINLWDGLIIRICQILYVKPKGVLHKKLYIQRLNVLNILSNSRGCSLVQTYRGWALINGCELKWNTHIIIIHVENIV